MNKKNDNLIYSRCANNAKVLSPSACAPGSVASTTGLPPRRLLKLMWACLACVIKYTYEMQNRCIRL